MYLIERCMKILKRYVKKSHRLQHEGRYTRNGTQGVTIKSMGWKKLAHEPIFDIICWNGYDINKFSFYIKLQDDKSTVQNSKVMVVDKSMHFFSSKDKNSIMTSIYYFGVIEDI
ncbi:hypothetical protein CR513_38346, partial [Mucuna pruriens]